MPDYGEVLRLDGSLVCERVVLGKVFGKRAAPLLRTGSAREFRIESVAGFVLCDGLDDFRDTN